MKRWVATILALAALGATPAIAEPAFWKVSDADSSVHIFGSVHLFTRPIEWRTEAFDSELKDAEHVYLKMVFDEAAYATFARVMLVEGRLRDGKTLWDLLTADEALELREVLATHNIDPATVEQLTPWMAELMLTTGLLAGALPGVDTAVAAEVEIERQRGLETAEEQIGFLSEGSEAEQVAGLMTSVRQLANSDGLYVVGRMMDAWEAGDTDALHELTASGLGDDRYDILITQRNARWVTQISEMLAENDDAMVVVGAGHLVGPDGVPELLERQGFTVERIDDSPAAAVPQRPERSSDTRRR